jgi:hypothetical protein
MCLGADAGRGRLEHHGVTAQRAAGHGGRELDGQEQRKTAEPGPLRVPCEPTFVVTPAARGRRASKAGPAADAGPAGPQARPPDAGRDLLVLLTAAAWP